MACKQIISTICICLAVMSFNADAEITSIDWKVAGDNLITRDSSSGLDWLDLTETNNMSYDYVNGQLSEGGQFDGWRFATIAEVSSLWLSFGVDLYEFGTIGIGIDTDVISASLILGNIVNEYDSSIPYGTMGLTQEENQAGGVVHTRMGAYIMPPNTHYETPGLTFIYNNEAYLHTGSYLVQTSPIPISASIWLFGSGLIGLIGLTRRMNNSK